MSVLLLNIGNVLAAEVGTVLAVVDGDTIKVELPSGVETVRLIGVDTPVHPQKPVEHFGHEASSFTKRMAEGRVVRLEEDGQSANRDRYGRLLRYVFLPDGRMLNAEIVAQGYGSAYVKYPFDRMEEFRGLERMAREGSLGLWATVDVPVAQKVEATVTPKAVEQNEETVYVTKSGTKYHRSGCRHLSKSQVPLPLKDAAARYSPCSVCSPPTSSISSAKPATSKPSAMRCAATTKKGTRCSRNAAAGSAYCWQHGR
ncbi:MAG: thermonuclease family protein [Candidatus Polarisedimenticolia bacterium]